MDCSPPGSSVHGILQARILEWVAMPFPREFPDSGLKLGLLHWQVDSLPSELPAKPHFKWDHPPNTLHVAKCQSSSCGCAGWRNLLHWQGLNYVAWSSYVGGKCMSSITSFHSQWGNGGLERFASFLKIAQLFPSEDRMEGVLSHEVLLSNCPFLLRQTIPPGQSQPWLYMRITGGFLSYFFNLKNCFTMLC